MAICLSFLLFSSNLSAEYRTIERVSVSSSGEQTDNVSTDAAISGNGRFVAFVSYATNLVSDDVNDGVGIFVRDRQTGTAERVSLPSDNVS